MKYPFIPKSNLKLEIGEYWNLPLKNGENAFFVILDIPDKSDRMGVIIGMLDELTESEKLDPNKSYNKCIWQSAVHIKAIKECGGSIQGKIKPIMPVEELDSSGGPYCQVIRGFNVIRKATKDDISNLKVQTTSGYNIPRIIAEKYWTTR